MALHTKSAHQSLSPAMKNPTSQRTFMKSSTSRPKVRQGVETSKVKQQNGGSERTSLARIPTSTMPTTVHQLIHEIRDIHQALSALPNLSPGPQVNTLLTKLVQLCIQPYSEELATNALSTDEIQALCLTLRPLCATAEGELEKYWAHRIVASAPAPFANIAQSRSLLQSFPYYDNYLDLSRLECSVLEAFLTICAPDCRPSPCKLVFIGSGPMPLTSFCVLDRYPEAVVHNIDRDADALRISQELAHRCGYGDRMTFSCEDVSLNKPEGTPWTDYQVIFLAALVGMDTPSKTAILTDLAAKSEAGTLIVVRSAQGLRGMLYPVLELSGDLQRIGLEVLTVVHPWTKVVNSVVLLRVT